MNRQDVSKKVINFWPNHTAKQYVPIAFCNVVGEEKELVVTTDEGNERSKSNKKEKEKVVCQREDHVVINMQFHPSLGAFTRTREQIKARSSELVLRSELLVLPPLMIFCSDPGPVSGIPEKPFVKV